MSLTGKILITGASGFIGGHVSRYFAEKGAELSCMIRENSDLSFIGDLPVEYIKGDITRYEDVLKASAGKSAIIHIAGLTADWGRWKDFKQINVEGTMNILKAARDSGIDQVIITGSISSYGEEHSEKIKDEGSPHNSHYPYFLDSIFPSGMNHYRDSKSLSTRMAIDFASQNNINLTVIEPVWVYGENEFNNGFYEYIKAVRSGIRFMPGSYKNNFHVVYAGDLAEAYYRAYTKNLGGINSFIIGNESAENMSRIFSLFCTEAGVKKPCYLPRLMVYPPAFLMELMAHLFKLRKAPLLTRSRVNMFYDNIEYSTRRSKELLSFSASTTLENGIRKTVSWYNKHKHL
jgi:nucleoside-diphosphate-sugar epimerase